MALYKKNSKNRLNNVPRVTARQQAGQFKERYDTQRYQAYNLPGETHPLEQRGLSTTITQNRSVVAPIVSGNIPSYHKQENVALKRQIPAKSVQKQIIQSTSITDKLKNMSMDLVIIGFIAGIGAVLLFTFNRRY